MHHEQRDFCLRAASRWPHLFQGTAVLDCGSLDINGNNRHLFSGCQYTGIDLVAGQNVDVVTRIHEFTGGPFGVVISTECLEHDAQSHNSLMRMIEMVSVDGLLLVTCATNGRAEHGTSTHESWASPGTLDHYRNISPSEVIEPLQASFHCWGVEIHHGDLYGWGIHKI